MARVYKKLHKTCERCGISYPRHRKFSREQWAASRYCGQKCTGEAATEANAKKRPELKDKFCSFFEKADGCWIWNGTIEGYGYGVIDHNSKRYRAHVLALEFDGRPVPRGMRACHHCDNRKCVNPSHLYVGTDADNARDAVLRGRLAFGERNFNARLTEGAVREMRSISDMSFADMARKYGVSRPTATRAFKGHTWRHVQ